MHFKRTLMLLIYLRNGLRSFQKVYYAVAGEGQVVGACDCGNEASGFMKCGEFLD